ncbi:hypothetical protein DFP74_1575 [Nocardiopsis sp. Huas11]|nr:hypothetical protein DFP74_1575 [Nocardiopsis sp. Huas11]
MNQPSGRHRRPSRSLAEQVRRVAATVLAAALAYVFVPRTPRRQRPALGPAPERVRLPAARKAPTAPVRFAPASDEDPGALVRPYMPPFPPPLPQARPLPVPRPRPSEGGGDLLATPGPRPPDDLGDLTAAVRAWLDMTRGADRR